MTCCEYRDGCSHPARWQVLVFVQWIGKLRIRKVCAKHASCMRQPQLASEFSEGGIDVINMTRIKESS